MFLEELAANASRRKQQENREKRRKLKQEQEKKKKKKKNNDEHKTQTTANKAAVAAAFNEAVPNPIVEFLRRRLVEELKAKLQVKEEAESTLNTATLRHSHLDKLSKEMLMVVNQNNNNLKKDLEEKQSELSSSKEQVKKLEDSRKELLEKKRELSSSKEKAESTLNTATLGHSHLDKLSKEMMVNLRKELEKKQSELSSSKEQVEDSRKELLEKKRELSSSNSSKEKAESTLNTATLRHSRCDKLSKQVLVNLNKVLEGKKSEINTLKDSKEKLQGKLDDELKVVNASLEQSKEELKAANGSSQNANNELSSLKGNLEKLEDLMKVLEGDLKTANGSLQEKSNELERSKEELKAANDSLENANSELSSLKGNLEELENRMEVLKEDLEIANGSLEEKSNELERSKKELNAANEKEVSSLRQSKAVSEREERLKTLMQKRLEDNISEMNEIQVKLKTAVAEKQRLKQSEDQHNKLNLSAAVDILNANVAANETKLKETANELEQERTETNKLRIAIEELWKNRSTTLVHAIKTGSEYPTGTHANIEKFVENVLKRYEDKTTTDDPLSFFPIEQGDESSTDLLQVLTGEQNMVNLIQSDPILVSTFNDLVQKSFAAKVTDVEFLDTLLSFNSWVSKMIFKNISNLYTAITNIKGKSGSKRCVDDDLNSGTKKKAKLPANIRDLNCQKYAAATAISSVATRTNVSSTTTNRTQSTQSGTTNVSSAATNRTRATQSGTTVVPPSPVKIVKQKVKLPYSKSDARVGLLVSMSIGSEGEKSPFPSRHFLLDSRVDNNFWFAYRVERIESTGRLFCPFCSFDFAIQGFTNHSKSCKRKEEIKKEEKKNNKNKKKR